MTRPPKPYTTEHLLYQLADVDNLRQDLSRLTWSSCPTNDRLFGSQVQHWTSSLVDAQLKNLPRRTVRVNPGSKPWYNSYLQHLAECRDRLFRRSRKLDPSSKTAVAYCKMRNLYNCELPRVRTFVISALSSLIESWIHAAPLVEESKESVRPGNPA